MYFDFLNYGDGDFSVICGLYYIKYYLGPGFLSFFSFLMRLLENLSNKMTQYNQVSVKLL